MIILVKIDHFLANFWSFWPLRVEFLRARFSFYPFVATTFPSQFLFQFFSSSVFTFSSPPPFLLNFYFNFFVARFPTFFVAHLSTSHLLLIFFLFSSYFYILFFKKNVAGAASRLPRPLSAILRAKIAEHFRRKFSPRKISDLEIFSRKISARDFSAKNLSWDFSAPKNLKISDFSALQRLCRFYRSCRFF